MKFLEFLKGSTNFVGVTFNGCFDIKIDVLNIIYNHYNESGKNLLDAYCNAIHMHWSCDDSGHVITDIEFNNYHKELAEIRQLNILSYDEYRDVIAYLNTGYINYKNKRDYDALRPRRSAQSFIQKKHIRKAVFDKYGKLCLACGSNQNIAIDHVISVYNGGQNTIENLQPLCGSCNSKKGTKNIDYRKNTING